MGSMGSFKMEYQYTFYHAFSHCSMCKRAFQGEDMGSRGDGTAPIPSLNAAIGRVIERLYLGMSRPLLRSPTNSHLSPNATS
jgi:hypothetical protein